MMTIQIAQLGRASDDHSEGRGFERQIEQLHYLWGNCPAPYFKWRSGHLLAKNRIVLVITFREHGEDN